MGSSPSAGLPASGSVTIMALTGLLSRGFLFGLNRTEIKGIENLTSILDERKAHPERIQQGLLTVSNHTSVLDDPLMWGMLPIRYMFSPQTLRWSLGSHDICFKTRLRGAFFLSGQVLPTYRLQHSPKGGIFQPVVSTVLDLLSCDTKGSPTFKAQTERLGPSSSTTETRRRQPSWVHIFPEGRTYQHPDVQMRYFKWGVSRLILEPVLPPTVLPIFISGLQNCMHESRKFPRFLPRIGKDILIVVGEPVPPSRWDVVRERWRGIKEKCEAVGGAEGERLLREGEEVVSLRIEVARMVRDEVGKLRLAQGYPIEDPGSSLAEFYRQEIDKAKREGVYEKDV